MDKSKILFVCLGNICRSPSAEAVFNGLVKEAGLSDMVEVDSAGTSGWHAGEPADHRMRLHARKRGYELTSLSRKFDPDVDFERFDLIIGMDEENIRNLKNMSASESDRKKLFKMTDFCEEWDYDSVPDPYYGGSDGFELVLDLLEDAGKGLLKKIQNKA